MIARGELDAPFDLTAPTNDTFYIARRNEVHATPIVRAFMDWLYATLES